MYACAMSCDLNLLRGEGVLSLQELDTLDQSQLVQLVVAEGVMMVGGEG